MTAVEECIHLLNPAWCADCNGEAAQARKDRDLEIERVLKLPHWVKANYPGRCALCREYYHLSTPIRHKTNLDRVPASHGNWIGMCCAPAGEPA